MLADDDTLYAALTRRDAAWEGRAFVGVTSTGIFCRLTCPAKKPKAENCRFLASAAACLDAGFRPCRRCHPMTPEAESDPAVVRLMAALTGDPSRRWRESDVAAMGLDPSTVRRAFRRQFGCTFLDMARRLRLRAGLETLAEGAPVIDAQLAAGFESPSAFRDAMMRVTGLRPGAFGGKVALWVDWIDTPLGAMLAAGDARHLHLLEFLDRKALPAEMQRLVRRMGGIGLGRCTPVDQAEAELAAYFAGSPARFSVKLAQHGSAFARAVWRQLQDIPAGQTRSYAQIAAAIGRPEAVRAVAAANGANQIAILVPCHRVIGADGALTGYGGGLWRKQKLIAHEARFSVPGAAPHSPVPPERTFS